jgi:mono/diheme cytochrome c family protein
MSCGKKNVKLFPVLLALVSVVASGVACIAASPTSTLDFSRDVRPILANNCFQCHGPDSAHREAKLRLDVSQSAGKLRGAQAVVNSAKPADSELIARITSHDPEVQMPPPDSGKSLKPAQIETLRQWVLQGAKYQQHWAFVAPQRPAIPAVKNQGWIRNPIDAFILARLEREGIEPSKPTSANAMLRRLSLDLIGLPPTPEEIAAYHSAAGEHGYDQQVERLLKSPHYGERWGRLWLDVARYADSDGFEKDKPRFVWMYRDWVINALNRNLPYDKFVIEQIAGDMLPSATQDQVVATGFLRNSMINEEGGIDPEQFRMEAMYDRMDAIGKSVLGLTIQCAQCHNHKYDPLTQAEYYRMFAFLNNCHEGQITVYTPAQNDEWQATDALIRRIENGLRAAHRDSSERMAAWEQTVRDDQPTWTAVRPDDDTTGEQKHYVLEDDSVLAAGYAPTMFATEFTAKVQAPKLTAVRLELLNDPTLPHGGPGRSIYGTFALTEFEVEAAPLDHPDKWTNLKFAEATADVNPPERELEKNFDDLTGRRRVTGPIKFAIDGDDLTAWTIETGPGRSNVPRKAVFLLKQPLAAPSGMRLRFKLTQYHGGWNSDDNENNNLGRFRFSITSADHAAADPLPADVRAIVKIPPSKRTPEQAQHIFSYWRTTVPEWQEENRRIEALWQSHPRPTTQLALLERTKPRETHRLERGNFLAPAERVTPGVPAFLNPLADDGSSAKSPPSRLDFAKWLVDRRSPTTARTIVNRIWQAYFGIGLVATSDDFGTQGEPPSHPELLDWLAVDLMDHGWDLKHLHRLIVSSSTYRQSSMVTPELLARDPANRLLARGPRYRVDAEIVRDIALSASGLLNEKVGGPSVHPPAPQFLFNPPASFGPKTWNVDAGPDRYRRALYTFRFRSVPYPELQNFDAPIGEVACARRARSNTPLQALTTLNEPVFVECARALAMRMIADGGNNDDQRIAYVVRRCLSREPQLAEVQVLREFLEEQKQQFSIAGADPWSLLVDDEKSKEKVQAKFPSSTSPGELAAWTALARVVLNLDETITKE